MGFKDSLNQMLQERYLKKYGDRMTAYRGNIISVKIEQKTILFFIHILSVSLLLKPERSKNIIRCHMKKRTFFKKSKIISLQQGQLIVVQGLKDKKGEAVEILNIQNITTKKNIVDIEGIKKNQNAVKTKVIRK